MNPKVLFMLSHALLLCGGLMLSARLASAQEPVTLTFEQPQTAGISGFRAMWDTPLVLDDSGVVEAVDKGEHGKGPRAVWRPEKRDGGAKPGALVFDAQHRSLLVRFPGAARQIAAQMARGYTVSKAEVLLPFRDTELWPEGYMEPSGLSFLGDLWAKNPPQWHAVAWALRKPWVADAQIGPTYNASINGAGYWKQFGAQDEKQDRFPMRFGHVEVSHKNTQGRLDVTPILRDAAFGATPQERLRTFESCGLLVRKWETYDVRYHQGGYEWGVATAGRGILIHTPKLIVTLSPGAKATPLSTANLAVDVPTLAARLQKNKSGGQPTAVMPSAMQIKVLAQKYGFNRPAWMPAWQWQRVSELKALGGFTSLPDTPEAYAAWIDEMLSIMPRRWDGWDGPDKLQTYYLYSAAWPAPVRQAWQDYWAAWLMPEKETKDFAHNQWNVADERGQENAVKYHARTGDWRGNVSFYRYSYTQNMSTMNFNHTAALGALLGGGIIGSRRAMEDGRHGLETCAAANLELVRRQHGGVARPLLFRARSRARRCSPISAPRTRPHDGTKHPGQVGRGTHLVLPPRLRRFIAMLRTHRPRHVFVQQEGTKHIVHTRVAAPSPTSTTQRFSAGCKALGRDRSARHDLAAGAQRPVGAGVGDEHGGREAAAYQMTNSYKQWGEYSATPLWKRNYMGRHYGLASVDLSGMGTVPVMAQWRRDGKTVENMDEVATLLIRPGVNHTNFLQTQNNGIVGQFGGMATLQHKNKMLVLSSPWKKKVSGGRSYPNQKPNHHRPLQFSEEPDVGNLRGWPARHRLSGEGQGRQRITVHDGVSYTGIIPLPSSDLGAQR